MKTTPSSRHGGASAKPADAWRVFLREWASTHDYSALVKLSRAAEKLASIPEVASRLVPVRLAVLSTATVDFLLPVLKGALFGAGLRPTLHVEPYGQVSTSLLDAKGQLAGFDPQVTLVIYATHHLPGQPRLDASLPEIESQVDEVCRSLLGPCETFYERTGSEVVLNNFHPLPWRAAGNLGVKLPGDPNTFIRRVNLSLADRASRNIHIADVASLAERRGLDTWFDERYWYLAKQPVSFAHVADYAGLLAGLTAAILGRTRKCLILDLDNTLWGGVIGDDGLAGIQIGEGSAEGEAFKALQTYARDLKTRGVLLAVCSKNDESIAKSAFTDHPEMVLKLDDFAAFKANWQPKSENIRAIARELDLPLEAFVFVDDNPAERHEVSRELPEVAVPDLTEDVGTYVRALDAERLFETVSLTEEDLRRTETYEVRRQSLQALNEATDIPAYLTSLAMEAEVRPFEPVSMERITQLVNKTNQFNLTTPRMVRAEIESLAVDPVVLTRTVRLRDRFGDHGLISVLFARIANEVLTIEAWLMSCRVLGRGVERLLFNDLLAAARDLGLREIIGWYKPSARNGLVKDHYAQLGFQRDGGEDGVEQWCIEVKSAAPLETFIAASARSEQESS